MQVAPGVERQDTTLHAACANPSLPTPEGDVRSVGCTRPLAWSSRVHCTGESIRYSAGKMLRSTILDPSWKNCETIDQALYFGPRYLPLYRLCWSQLALSIGRHIHYQNLSGSFP